MDNENPPVEEHHLSDDEDSLLRMVQFDPPDRGANNDSTSDTGETTDSEDVVFVGESRPNMENNDPLDPEFLYPEFSEEFGPSFYRPEQPRHPAVLDPEPSTSPVENYSDPNNEFDTDVMYGPAREGSAFRSNLRYESMRFGGLRLRENSAPYANHFRLPDPGSGGLVVRHSTPQPNRLRVPDPCMSTPGPYANRLLAPYANRPRVPEAHFGGVSLLGPAPPHPSQFIVPQVPYPGFGGLNSPGPSSPHPSRLVVPQAHYGGLGAPGPSALQANHFVVPQAHFGGLSEPGPSSPYANRFVVPQVLFGGFGSPGPSSPQVSRFVVPQVRFGGFGSHGPSLPHPNRFVAPQVRFGGLSSPGPSTSHASPLMVPTSGHSSSVIIKMSRHEGVSCDSCLKNNFRGRRYKCLVCYDYDLCAVCYESGATNTRHTTDHPMQCILTRSDFDVYYGGEAISTVEMPQSYTCPYCSRMGFTDVTLQEHVTADHQDTNFEVVCPLCAAMPGGDPNLMTDDFAGHLTLEHRSGARDLISFLDEPVATRHNVRRMPHTSSSHSGTGRGAASLRPRRSNMHFSSSGLASLSPSSRDTVDPIAELLSQLSGVRRSTSSTTSSTPTQLQQLQMQLQLERQQVNAARQNLERFPRRPTQNQTLREAHTSNFGTSTILLNASPVLLQPSNNTSPAPTQGYNPQFLLTSLLEEPPASSSVSEERQERCAFVQELVLSTMACLPGQETCQETFNRLIRASRAAERETSVEEEEVRPQRPSSTVLRGRARQDNQNCKRRAEANRKDENKDGDSEGNR